LALLLAGTALIPACSRQKTDAVQEAPKAAVSKPVSELLSTPADNASPVEPPPSGPAPGPAAETPSAVASTPETAPPGTLAPSEREIIENLQAALKAYYLKNVNSPDHYAAPRSLDELVRSGILKSLPNPPPGKKFVYHPENWQVTIE
jgi:hypothetical protein